MVTLEMWLPKGLCRDTENARNVSGLVVLTIGDEEACFRISVHCKCPGVQFLGMLSRAGHLCSTVHPKYLFVTEHSKVLGEFLSLWT